MKAYARLLEPRSIAVVGVSDEAGRPGSQAVRALRHHGYAGRIHPVNPKYETFDGLKCYPAIDAIEDSIDLVIIGVPAKAVVAVVQACAAKGVPYAVILSGGFRETGPEGVERERQLLRIARSSGMRIIGPNCLGVVNLHERVYAAFGSMTREPVLPAGNVSLVTQSGGFGYSIALACAQAGIGFRHVIATGNEVDVDTVELIDALVDDPHTHCIVSYTEGVRDGRRLLRAGRKALAAGKPLLLWKGGVTDQGARAAESHTASMTGTYDFYRALYTQTGIVELSELHEVADVLAVLRTGTSMASNRAAVLGVSGGSAIVFADAGARAGLVLADLAAQTQQRLAQVVPSIGAIGNPVDLTAGYFAPGNEAKVRAALQAVLDDPGVDAVCINIATTGHQGALTVAQAVLGLHGTGGSPATKPIVVFSSMPRAMMTDALAVFEQAKVPVFPTPGRAAAALAKLAHLDAARRRLLGAQSGDDSRNVAAPATDDHGAGNDAPTVRRGAHYSEAESKQLLAQAGIPVTRDILLRPGAIPQLHDLAWPAVVKIVSRDIPHKSEIGGVKLGLASESEVRAAIDEVQGNARRLAPAAVIEGVLVSQMIDSGYELIAGIINDAVFGPVVMVGSGGIYAEVWKDVSYRLAPFDDSEALAMIDELRCRPILDGARGGAVLDKAAAARALATLSRFAWTHRDTVQEVDINPLFIGAGGVIAADALVVAKPVEAA
jgi:acetyltransferase